MPTLADPAIADRDLGLLRVLREDWEIHWREFTRPGFQAIAVYRLSRWLDQGAGWPMKRMLGVVCRGMEAVVRRRFDIDVDSAALLGRRVQFGHQGGIMIRGDVVMGDDCIVLQGVKIGNLGGSDRPGAPRIGSRVKFGARAVVDGGIYVGDDVRVGPNAVVTTDVPANAVAIAPPSRLDRKPVKAEGAG